MSKKHIQNGALIPAEDEQIIAELTAYLSVSLRNERSKYLKKYGKIRDFESSIEDLKPDFEPEDRSFEERIEQMLAWDMVKNYLPLLTSKECEVVLCLYVNRLSTADTAKKMNLSPETVRWHKKNALQKIRKAMEEND